MRAFWWFKENSIAGMARPGFNSVHWFDLPFDEAVAMGWIGQYSSGSESLDLFRRHLKSYAPKIYKFYQLDERTGPEAIRIFNETHGFAEVLDRLAERTGFLESYSVAGDRVHIEISKERLERESEFLKSQGIGRIVSLTESHHNKDFLQDHFVLHHLSIEDLGAPRVEQVHELVEVIQAAKKDGEGLAVHCLAGIGRTSTMLMASHMLMGEKFEELRELLSKKNPAYVLTGPQGDFVRSLAGTL